MKKIMVMNDQFAFVFSLLFSFLFADSIHTQTSCTCTDQLETLITYTKENYPFYTIKVTAENEKFYDAYNAVFLYNANGISKMDDCIYLLRKYLTIFRDGHLYMKTGKNLDILLNEKWDGNLSDISAYFTDDPFTGIWNNGTYRVAIIPHTENNFSHQAVLLHNTNEFWQGGDIKFKIKKINNELIYHMGMLKKNVVEVPLEYVLNETSAQLGAKGLGVFYKEIQTHSEFNLAEEVSEVLFEKMTDKTFLIKITSFRDRNRSIIDSLISVYHNEIISSDNLIIDVRYNSGGSDRTYYGLLPYIYSGSVELPGVGYYLSPENKKLFLSLAPEDSAISKTVKSMPDFSIYNENEIYIHELDTIYSMPKKVAIIQNEKTISSGETFITRVKQSNRVVTYGVNTAGIVDGFNGNVVDLACVTIQYPTTFRSMTLPEDAIDPYGIAPDIYMKDFMNNPYPFVISHLELMND